MALKPPGSSFPRRPGPGDADTDLPPPNPVLQSGLEAPDLPEDGIPLAAPPLPSAPAPDVDGLPVVESGGIGGIDSNGAAGEIEDKPRPVIRALGMKNRHEDEWDRSPNSTGTGAIHVRTFHCKLNDDALRSMDRRINEWLDDHPQYEVKFVNSTVGILTGKTKEPHLLCQVWV